MALLQVPVAQPAWDERDFGQSLGLLSRKLNHNANKKNNLWNEHPIYHRYDGVGKYN